MKTKLKLAGCALLLCSLAGCTPDVKGVYSCKDGFLETIKLESGGTAQVSANLFGVKQAKTGTYKVDGDKVVITLDMQAQTFTRKDKVLDGGPALGVCTIQ